MSKADATFISHYFTDIEKAMQFCIEPTMSIGKKHRMYDCISDLRTIRERFLRELEPKRRFGTSQEDTQ